MHHGLTVRWSLADAPVDVLDRLHLYVEEESHSRFAALSGLRFKTWRARAGEWFEGSYVFVDGRAREQFQTQFTHDAAVSKVSLIIGASPILIEDVEVVAVVRGPAGFRSSARFES